MVKNTHGENIRPWLLSPYEGTDGNKEEREFKIEIKAEEKDKAIKYLVLLINGDIIPIVYANNSVTRKYSHWIENPIQKDHKPSFQLWTQEEHDYQTQNEQCNNMVPSMCKLSSIYLNLVFIFKFKMICRLAILYNIRGPGFNWVKKSTYYYFYLLHMNLFLDAILFL